MFKLSRNKWRQQSSREDDDKFSLPTWDDPSQSDSRPIDTKEQEELIRSFERQQSQQSFLWRSVFAALLICFVTFLIFSIYHQVSYPWELNIFLTRNQHVFVWMNSKPIYTASIRNSGEGASHCISKDWAAVLACLMAIKGLLHNTKYHQKWIWYSFCTGLSLSVFWLYHMIRMPRFRWDILWLPFGPLSGSVISLYVDRILTESSEEIRKLRGYTYAYKAK